MSLEGALRFNDRLQPWNDQQELRGGDRDIGFDMLAINQKTNLSDDISINVMVRYKPDLALKLLNQNLPQHHKSKLQYLIPQIKFIVE